MSQVTQTIDAAASAIGIVRRSRLAALTLVVTPIVLAGAVVATLELKSVQYGLPVADLLQPPTARLWVYESIVADGLLAPAPAYVKVRWTPGTDDAMRAALEVRYGLEAVEPHERGTWVYRLRRFSHRNVTALLADPALEDTEGFDLRGFAPPAEPLSAAVRRVSQFGPVHVLLGGIDPSARERTIALVRRGADPLTRWTFFGAVGGVCAVVLAMRARHAVETVTWRASVPWRRGLADLLIGESRGRSPRRATTYTILLAALALVTCRDALWPAPALTNAPFAVRAIDAAIARTLCGTLSSVPADSLAASMLNDDRLFRAPIRDVVEERFGSATAFCASVDPYHVEENSPVLLMSGILSWRPDLSIHTLGYWMHGTKLLAVALTAWLCLAIGLSVVTVALIGWLLIAVLAEVGDTYVQYSFLGLMLALGAATCAFVARPDTIARWPAARAWAFLLGVITAAGVNMRTSHAPIYATYLALLLVLVIAARAWPGRAAGQRAVGWIGVVALTVLLGYLSFAATFEWPIRTATEEVRFDYTGHPVAHAVVLSLALSSPEALAQPSVISGNALSQREGIVFKDERGLELARRMQPDVEYLGPSYERAMWSYYFALWRRYPAEIAHIYADKFHLVSDGIRGWLRREGHHWTNRVARRALDAVWPESVALFWLFLAVFAGAVAGYARTASGTAAVLAFLSLAACLVYLEAAIVVPRFDLAYYNLIPIYLGVLVILLLQGAIIQVSRFRRGRTA